MHDFGRILSTIVIAATTLTGATGAAAGTEKVQAPASPCVGVSSCHLVARTDVDGDQKTDQVGWRQLGKDAVQIRVRLAGGRLLTHRVDVHLWWGGGAWGGATRIDNQHGTELLIGSEQGAHTPMYTMLTYRDGSLIGEVSPSYLGKKWMVDAAYGDYVGWFRHDGPGGVTMTQKVAIRVEGTNRFTGTDVTYARGPDGWVHRSTTHVRYPTVKKAAAIGGFHVTGLARFPGLP